MVYTISVYKLKVLYANQIKMEAGGALRNISVMTALNSTQKLKLRGCNVKSL